MQRPIRRRIGPRDEGRLLTAEEYANCIDASGYRSEIIDGAIRVSRTARPLHDYLRTRIYGEVWQFTEHCPTRANYATTNCDVVILGRPGETRLQPDVAAYRDYPRDLALLLEKDDWSFFSPILVIEIISSRRSRKDTFRNRNLYWLVGEIQEYWVIDLRKSATEPGLIVHAREFGCEDWVEYELSYEETWRSSLIKGLEISLTRLD